MGQLKMVKLHYQKWPDLAMSSFNKTIKGSGTSFQSPALTIKHVRNVCHTAN